MTDKTPAPCGSDSSTELGLLARLGDWADKGSEFQADEQRKLQADINEGIDEIIRLRKALAAETERCAKVCDRVQAYHAGKAVELGGEDEEEADFREAEACGAEDCAEALRMGERWFKQPKTMAAKLRNEPTISIGIDKAEDGTFTAQMLVTGLETFAQANAAAEHMQRLFCGDEIEPADVQPNTN
jgi:hypothetical protein